MAVEIAGLRALGLLVTILPAVQVGQEPTVCNHTHHQQCCRPPAARHAQPRGLDPVGVALFNIIALIHPVYQVQTDVMGWLVPGCIGLLAPLSPEDDDEVEGQTAAVAGKRRRPKRDEEQLGQASCSQHACGLAALSPPRMPVADDPFHVRLHFRRRLR